MGSREVPAWWICSGTGRVVSSNGVWKFCTLLPTIALCIGEGDGTPLQYSCLENPMDGGAWKVAVHEVAKSRTRLNDFTFTFHFHALEKEVATHSSVLAWRIPGTAEPGGLPSMGMHWVEHDWSDLAAAALCISSILVFLSCILLCAKSLQLYLTVTLWTVAHQASPTTGFSRQEYWHG